MKSVKNFIKNKYFSMAIFGILLVVSIFALHLTIKHDVENAAVSDDMTRVMGKVMEVYGHTQIRDNGSEFTQYDIVVYVKLDDGKVYDGIPINDVPKCKEGDIIKLKYDSDSAVIDKLNTIEMTQFSFGNYYTEIVGGLKELLHAMDIPVPSEELAQQECQEDLNVSLMDELDEEFSELEISDYEKL